VSRCLPHSLADEKHVCSLVQDSVAPAQLRAAARDFPTLAAGLCAARASHSEH
jgi:hypothetical protein